MPDPVCGQVRAACRFHCHGAIFPFSIAFPLMTSCASTFFLCASFLCSKWNAACKPVPLSVRLSACSMCIRLIQHESVARVCVCVCIKLIKYVHVNAFRAAFCAAIIKFLIVAFYSHVSSRQADRQTDMRTADQRSSNGPTD